MVGVGATYVLGYVVRSIHAFQFSLGPLPALDSHYFIAGFVPAFILSLVWLTLRGLEHVRRQVPERLGLKCTGGWRLLRWLVFIALGTSTAAFLIVSVAMAVVDEGKQNMNRPLAVLTIILVVCLVFLPPMRKPDTNQPKRSLKRGLAEFTPLLNVYRRMGGLLGAYVVLMFAVVILTLYVSTLFPLIPQEFGGVRPRRAFLDLSTSDVSAATKSAILEPQDLEDGPGIARSRAVYVIFGGDEYLLVRPPNSNRLYHIRMQAIRAVVWDSENTDEPPDSDAGT